LSSQLEYEKMEESMNWNIWVEEVEAEEMELLLSLSCEWGGKLVSL